MRIRQLGFWSNPIQRIFALQFGRHGADESGGKRLETVGSDAGEADSTPAAVSNSRHSARYASQ